MHYKIFYGEWFCVKIDILVKFCTLFSFQLSFQRDTPLLQIKSSLYVWRRVQESIISKQNSVILIHSRVIPTSSLSSPHGAHTPMAVVGASSCHDSLIFMSTHKATAARCLSHHQATYGLPPSAWPL